MKLSFAFFLLGSTITNSPLLVSAFSSPSITASSSAKGASTIHQRLSGLPTKFVNHRAGVLGSSSNEASKKYKLSILSQSASETLSTEDNSADEGKQGLPGATFSLVKAIVGSGVFSLSAGVAAVGDVSGALIPASLLIFVLGGLSAYSFFNIGRISNLQGSDKSKSIGEAWEDEIGADSSWIVSLSCLLTPLGAALTYSIILGDMLSSLAQSAGLTGILARRQTSILGITAAVLYPLCNLSSLAALAPVSMIGVIGMVFTSLFMVFRAIPGGAYCAATGGSFLSTLAPALQPSFGVIGNNAYSASILILVSMAATAYLAHFSAQDFYDGLKEKTVKKFGVLTSLGFGIAALMNVIIMSAGFLTFGGNCKGMVLNNYSAKDIGATISRMIVTISLIGSYPIFMGAVKSSFYELFMKGKKVSERMNKIVTTTLLGALTSAALVLKDAGLMVSLSGAALGSAIIYIFPSLIYLKLTKRLIAEGKMKNTVSVKAERVFNKFLAVLGVALGILGTGVTLGVV